MPTAFRTMLDTVASGLPITGATNWYDGSDATSMFTDAGTTQVSANNDLIYQWNDKSGNARHATQTTSGSRPQYKTNVQNGLSVADFNSGRFLYVDIPSLANGFTLYTVLKYPSVGSGYYYVISRNAAVGGGAFGFGTRTSSIFLSQSAADIQSGATSTNTTYGVIGKYDGSHPTGNFRIRVSNAASDVTGTMTQNTGTPPAGTGQIGRADNNGAAFNGTIMELVLFDTQRSADDDTAMKTYLGDKWGIAWS